MGEMMNAGDIEELHEEGMISDEQRDAVLKYILAKSARDIPAPRNTTVYALATVAAGLISLGAIVLAVTHWQAISPLYKALSGMLIMLAAWVGNYRLRHKKPLVSEALGLLGACMWGANLLLINALYDLNVPAVETFFYFVVGVLPIPFLLRQRVLIGLVALSTFLLFITMLHTPAAESWLSLHALLATKGTVFSIIVALLLLWWMIAEKCRTGPVHCHSYGWIACPACGIFLCIVQLYLLYTPKPLITISHNWIIFAAVGLCVPLLRPRNIPWLPWLAAMYSSLALFPIAILISQPSEYNEVIGMLTCVAFSALLMVLGMRCGKWLWLNLSLAMMVFIFIDLIVRLSRALSDSGLFLMALGAAILVFAFLLEKQRRYLVKKVKQKTASTAPEK